MSYSKPQKLVRVKQLIEISKFDEADQLIKRFEEKMDYTLNDMILCHLLKCKLLYGRGLHEEVIKLAKQTYKESLGLGKNLLSVDILLIMADALFNLDQTDKSCEFIKQGEELLKTITSESPAEYKKREAYIAWLKGCVYTEKNDFDQAIKQHELSLSLREELGNKAEIAQSLYAFAYVFMIKKRDIELCSKYMERGLTIAEKSGHKGVIGHTLYYMGLLYRVKGELDQRIMVSEQALANFHEIKNKFMEARVLATLGESFGIKGELNRSIRFFEQSLELAKEIDYKWAIADALASIAFCYHMIGDLDRALECIEQAMVLNRELGFTYWLALNYDILIPILIDIGDLERARSSLRNFEQLNYQLKHKSPSRHNFLYLLDKALVLKTNPRARDRGMAEEILKNLLKEEGFFYEDRLIALLNLCELLLTDFKITNELEILEEINPLLKQLLDLSEKSHSIWILGETYLLQAKLALINLDMKGARRLLTRAQKIAESHGIKRLAMQISHEHDELLKEMKMWENLKESKASLSERWKFAGLNEQIEKSVRRRMIESPKISEENPVMLLILTEGGNLLFSKKFISDFSFEDDILGSFLTAVHYFINEAFSEGLDRAVFGQYTLLMNTLQPFLICYIFKGYSYSAQSKIKTFIDSIQNDKNIWQSLQKFFQKSTSVQLNDIPILESLIADIFVKKNLQ